MPNEQQPLRPGWSTTTLDDATARSVTSHPSADCYQPNDQVHLGACPGRYWPGRVGALTSVTMVFTNSADIVGFTIDCNAYLGTDITVLFGTAPTPNSRARPGTPERVAVRRLG